MSDITAKTAKNEIVLECDDLDYKAIQEAMARRQTMRLMPDHGSNLAGVLLAEICRGWMEMLEHGHETMTEDTMGESLRESLRNFAECKHSDWQCTACKCRTSLSTLQDAGRRDLHERIDALEAVAMELMELMDGAGVPVQKDGKPLDLVQRVILLIEDREQIQEAWSNYVDYLREKYPQPDGEFLFKCPHHHRINEVLK